MKPKVFLTISVVLVIILAMFLIIRWREENNPEYQIDKLRNGTTLQKIGAMEFIADKGVINAISDIMNYVDSDEYAMRGDVAWGLSCVATKSLGEITKLKFGETCNSDKLKSDPDIATIKKSWKNWYANEYPSWGKLQH